MHPAVSQEHEPQLARQVEVLQNNETRKTSNAQGKKRCRAQDREPKGNQADGQWQPGEEVAGVRVQGMNGWNCAREHEMEEQSGEGAWGC